MARCREKLYFCTRLSKRRAKEYMDTCFFLKKYLKHFFGAKDEYALHSPFMFDLFVNGLKSKSFRKEFRNFGNEIGCKQRSLLLPKNRNDVFLYSLLRYFSPRHILFFSSERESSLLCYLAQNKLPAKECNSLSLNSEKVFVAGYDHGKIVGSNVLQSVEAYCSDISTDIDFALIDCSLPKEPVLNYIDCLLPHCGNESVLILKNIYHDKACDAIFRRLKADNKWKVCADFFSFGVFFMTSRPLQRQEYLLCKR